MYSLNIHVAIFYLPFFYFLGGRGDNGSPVIVFPEFPAFGEITDGEFDNVLTYLTSVPR